MTKMQIDNIPSVDMKIIREWYAEYKKRYPNPSRKRPNFVTVKAWYDYVMSNESYHPEGLTCSICRSFFPVAQKKEICPCGYYSPYHVMQIVKQIVEGNPSPERRKAGGSGNR